MAIMTLDEARAVTDKVFDESRSGIDHATDTNQSARTTDDFPRDQLAMAAPERVQDTTARQRCSNHWRQLGDHRCVGGPRMSEHFIGAVKVRF